MRKTYLPIVLIICLFGSFGCRKDNSAFVSATIINGELLIGKSWKLTAYTEDGKDALNTMYAPCELDDTEKYLPGGVFNRDEGVTKCDPSDPQIEEALWELKGNKLTLSDEELSFALVLTIQTLTSTTLKCSMKNLFGPEIYVYTFIAQ